MICGCTGGAKGCWLLFPPLPKQRIMGDEALLGCWKDPGQYEDLSSELDLCRGWK